MNSPSMTLADLRHLAIHQLEPWMVYAPWRSTKDYAQRRIHQRVDNASKDFRGWRVSVESTADARQALNQNRLRCQKSFYFGTVGSFEGATLEAQAYRDSCEKALGLVPWRLKKLEHVEDAFAVSGIVLNVGKRAPFWIYRQNGRRLIGSIAQLGLRGAYTWLAERVAEIEGTASVPSDIPMPLLTADQEAGLIAYGIAQMELEVERQHSKQWAVDYVAKHAPRNK
ncbi:hypothetical protein [Pseudomonas sp. Leaf58]|uniref:hypothetical protein n=1 Tax=Pseudomonas sp. Leaf58 TaxID=1736226 RepID=UPI000A521B21|nr:hypothetical protein [Pseudomonas sp. Leaf58]